MSLKILLTGNSEFLPALRSLLPERHSIEFLRPDDVTTATAGHFNLIIDPELDENPERLNLYAGMLNRPVIGRAVTRSLASICEMAQVQPECVLIGMNLLPGFLQRPHAEVSLLNEKDQDTLDNLMNLIGLPYTRVEDRAGLVSPRILCMIINEACFLLQEKGATQSGIDTAMLLGVNYPKGPLAWADEIGIPLVVKTLQGIHQETGDDRYRVCPALLRMAQMKQSFYS